MTQALHIPLDFERRETVRLLAHRLLLIGVEFSEMAPLYALRVWLDWGAVGKQLRPLQKTIVGKPREHTRSLENITFVLEDAARWKGAPGALIVAMLDAGFLEAPVHASGHASLLLEGFWMFNEHLSPDYKTIQQRGAAASNAKREMEKLSELAADRRKVFEAQGILPFGSDKPTEQEQEACYALFMRLHRECALELPNTEEFTEHNMRAALAVIRRFTPVEISTAEQWIIDHAQEIDFVKNPARILETFADYIMRASEVASAS